MAKYLSIQRAVLASSVGGAGTTAARRGPAASQRDCRGEHAGERARIAEMYEALYRGDRGGRVGGGRGDRAHTPPTFRHAAGVISL